jgi:hypothetical protein
MRAIGRRHITSVETADQLVVRVVRENGWLELAVGPAISTFALFWAVHIPSFWAGVISLVAAAGTIANWLHGNTTELFVSRNGLVVRGNVGKVFSDQLFISAGDIVSLGYEVGGEDEPSGFYARHRIGGTCLLIGLNEQQSIDLATAIFKRFPDIGSGDTEPGSILFGRGSGPVTLGLSQND